MEVITKATLVAVLITLGLGAFLAAVRQMAGARAAEPAGEKRPQTPHPLDMPHRCTENQKPYQ